jgi:hypothetical protein
MAVEPDQTATAAFRDGLAQTYTDHGEWPGPLVAALTEALLTPDSPSLPPVRRYPRLTLRRLDQIGADIARVRRDAPCKCGHERLYHADRWDFADGVPSIQVGDASCRQCNFCNIYRAADTEEPT